MELRDLINYHRVWHIKRFLLRKQVEKKEKQAQLQNSIIKKVVLNLEPFQQAYVSPAQHVDHVNNYFKISYYPSDWGIGCSEGLV